MDFYLLCIISLEFIHFIIRTDWLINLNFYSYIIYYFKDKL